MRIIKVQPLTHDTFSLFGDFYSMTSPEGYALQGDLHRFFPDRMEETYTTRVGFSPIMVKKPAEMKITQLEYHTTSPEIIIPLNDDMILHVGPSSAGVPKPELTKAFFVPKGTMIKMKSAIWHLCPLPAKENELQAMIILPECTYANDCTVVDLKDDEQFIIER